MLESRANYGYFGEGHGITGEQAPTKHASGWRIFCFYFTTSDGTIEVRAKDYENAVKAAKKWAKRDGFTFIGDADGYADQRSLK